MCIMGLCLVFQGRRGGPFPASFQFSALNDFGTGIHGFNRVFQFSQFYLLSMASLVPINVDFTRTRRFASHNRKHWEEITHKAVIWKMPLAVGAGSDCGRDGTFFQIPTKYNVLFYFWGPDAMFNDLNPVPLSFAYAIFFTPVSASRLFGSTEFASFRNGQLNLEACAQTLYNEHPGWGCFHSCMHYAPIIDASHPSTTRILSCFWSIKLICGMLIRSVMCGCNPAN